MAFLPSYLKAPRVLHSHGLQKKDSMVLALPREGSYCLGTQRPGLRKCQHGHHGKAALFLGKLKN